MSNDHFVVFNGRKEYLHWFVVVVVVVVDMLLFTLSGDADAVDVREAPA